jgi:hypothetical protein
VNFTRRGFLSLVSAGVGELVAARVMQALPAPAWGRVGDVFAPQQSQLVQRFVMPFSPELGFQEIVPPGGVTRMMVRSQTVFRPDRLIFASGVDLSKFAFLKLECGDSPEADQIVGEVAAELFAPNGYGTRLGLSTMAPGDEIVLAVRNTSKVEAEFGHAAIIGSRVS